MIEIDSLIDHHRMFVYTVVLFERLYLHLQIYNEPNINSDVIVKREHFEYFL